MIKINKIIVDKFCKFFTIYAGGIYKSNWKLRLDIERLYYKKSGPKIFSSHLFQPENP